MFLTTIVVASRLSQQQQAVSCQPLVYLCLRKRSCAREGGNKRMSIAVLLFCCSSGPQTYVSREQYAISPVANENHVVIRVIVFWELIVFLFWLSWSGVSLKKSTFFFLSFFSFYYLRPSFFSLSLLVVTQMRGHIAASSPPLPTTVRALHFYCEKISALSSLVDSRRIVRTCSVPVYSSTIYYFVYSGRPRPPPLLSILQV